MYDQFSPVRREREEYVRRLRNSGSDGCFQSTTGSSPVIKIRTTPRPEAARVRSTAEELAMTYAASFAFVGVVVILIDFIWQIIKGIIWLVKHLVRGIRYIVKYVKSRRR